ncbi:hypothetical protein [Spirabiliibacterium mucosae]|uniref:hypothetical protein n=1 Tax=Spirabiliibacterium mucosae TaxID=28156 RepID=UPI001F1EA33E|nr:hypothetical protein [Spirabiliibacterium mucosae]
MPLSVSMVLQWVLGQLLAQNMKVMMPQIHQKLFKVQLTALLLVSVHVHKRNMQLLWVAMHASLKVLREVQLLVIKLKRKRRMRLLRGQMQQHKQTHLLHKALMQQHKQTHLLHKALMQKP